VADEVKRKRGRPKGSLKQTSLVEARALQYALAGAPAHTAAVAAMTEKKADPARVAAVEAALTAASFGRVVVIDEHGQAVEMPVTEYAPPTDADIERARKAVEHHRAALAEPAEIHPADPAADMDDGEQSYTWMPAAFAQHGKHALKAAGVQTLPYVDAKSTANTLAQYVRRRAKAAK
jgi:hypothetical protein